MKITNNPDRLTDAERANILACTKFSYTYGVGLVFLDNGATWDCTDSVAAKEFLRKAGKKEDR